MFYYFDAHCCGTRDLVPNFMMIFKYIVFDGLQLPNLPSALNGFIKQLATEEGTKTYQANLSSTSKLINPSADTTLVKSITKDVHTTEWKGTNKPPTHDGGADICLTWHLKGHSLKNCPHLSFHKALNAAERGH
jgi:hypothetical protein